MKFKGLRENYPNLQEAYEYVLMILGNRREKMAIFNREIYQAPLFFMMPHYDEDWDNQIARRAALRKDSKLGQGNANVTVLMQTYGENNENTQNKNDDVQDKTK